MLPFYHSKSSQNCKKNNNFSRNIGKWSNLIIIIFLTSPISFYESVFETSTLVLWFLSWGKSSSTAATTGSHEALSKVIICKPLRCRECLQSHFPSSLSLCLSILPSVYVGTSCVILFFSSVKMKILRNKMFYIFNYLSRKSLTLLTTLQAELTWRKT